MSKARTTPDAPLAFRVAYHDGPPEITFLGIVFRRGEARAVSDQEWTAMRARGDFAEFDFRVVGEPAHHPSPITHHAAEE